MFRYNNKTYRIDGIAWDHTPSNTFKRGDADTSFKNYYKSVGIVHSTLKKKKKPSSSYYMDNYWQRQI